jgi:hypothetical protein
MLVISATWEEMQDDHKFGASPGKGSNEAISQKQSKDESVGGGELKW